MSILVFGSINMDLTTYADRLPRLGETFFGSSYQLSPGGKGANQAVAAARLGAQSSFIGRTGNDEFGAQALAALASNGVNTSGVLADPEQATGLAVINVNQHGDNTIIVISGANMAMNQQDVARASTALSDASVLLLQLEIPLKSSLQLAAAAKQRGVSVILDPAPVEPLNDDALTAIDILTPNEIEAEALVGYPVHSIENAKRAAHDLRRRGAGTVIIKRGEHGAYFESDSESGLWPAFKVRTIDTVAAGDAFNAGLAVALSEGSALPAAIRLASAAGALATTVKGAIAAMPTREQVQDLLANGSSL